MSPTDSGGRAELEDALTSARADLATLQRALASSRSIGMAMGILMERHKVTDAQAFDLLREASQRGNVKLRDLAERLVATGSLTA